jgi:hypothetical protein
LAHVKGKLVRSKIRPARLRHHPTVKLHVGVFRVEEGVLGFAVRNGLVVSRQITVGGAEVIRGGGDPALYFLQLCSGNTTLSSC